MIPAQIAASIIDATRRATALREACATHQAEFQARMDETRKLFDAKDDEHVSGCPNKLPPITRSIFRGCMRCSWQPSARWTCTKPLCCSKSTEFYMQTSPCRCPAVLPHRTSHSVQHRKAVGWTFAQTGPWQYNFAANNCGHNYWTRLWARCA